MSRRCYSVSLWIYPKAAGQLWGRRRLGIGRIAFDFYRFSIVFENL